MTLGSALALQGAVVFLPGGFTTIFAGIALSDEGETRGRRAAFRLGLVAMVLSLVFFSAAIWAGVA